MNFFAKQKIGVVRIAARFPKIDSAGNAGRGEMLSIFKARANLATEVPCTKRGGIPAKPIIDETRAGRSRRRRRRRRLVLGENRGARKERQKVCGDDFVSTHIDGTLHESACSAALSSLRVRATFQSPGSTADWKVRRTRSLERPRYDRAAVHGRNARENGRYQIISVMDETLPTGLETALMRVKVV